MKPVMPHAQLDWDDQGRPYSRVFDDVYFSDKSGLDETRYVFIEQNRLVAKTGADAVEGANIYSVSFDAAGRPVLTNAAGTLDQNAASLHFVQKITVDLSIGPNLDGSTGGRVEAIQRVLAENDGNISATARALKMHRRTLQRKLAKRPVKE
mgnify:CR=1 FL=1